MARPAAEHTYDTAMATLLREFASQRGSVLHPHIVVQRGTFVPAATHRRDTKLPHEMYRRGEGLPDESVLFDVRFAGRSEWLRGDQCVRSRSDITAIELVTDGAGELVVGRTRYALKPGDVFVLHTDERHVYRACSRTPFRKLFVTFNAIRPLHRQALALTGLNAISHLPLEPATAERVRAIIERIIDVLRAAKPDSSHRASAFAYELVLELMRTQPGDGKGQPLPRAVDTVVSHVIEHLSEPCALVSLSPKAGISPDYLSRLFIKHLGTNYQQWLLRLRMSVASRLLLHTMWKIYVIGERVGYGNAYAFTRAFRKVTGCTPEEFRRRSWNVR